MKTAAPTALFTPQVLSVLVRPLIHALVLTATIPIFANAQQPCGGVERWPVKVGSDPDAAAINVSAPVPTLIHDLIQLPRPTLPSDDSTRLAQERTVRVVDGRLVKFKLESGRSGDSDYHLVISDDTLLFTPGGSGPALNHSFVAEIVDPDCVPGRHGNSSITSVWATQLQVVYDKFQQQFTNITGGWNNANGIPVRVTGVGFFDQPHGQTGRSPNGIEIHPILDIAFDPTPLSPTPTPDPATVLALTNPGFENGTTGWSASAGVISADQNEPARTGTRKAWLGGYGEVHTDRLSQRVTLPASATGISLRFYLHVSTEEQTTQMPYDKLRVRVTDANGSTLLRTLRTYSNLQAEPGYHLQTFNLTDFRGQTIRFQLVAEEDNGSMTSFVVDDFEIVVES